MREPLSSYLLYGFTGVISGGFAGGCLGVVCQGAAVLLGLAPTDSVFLEGLPLFTGFAGAGLGIFGGIALAQEDIRKVQGLHPPPKPPPDEAVWPPPPGDPEAE